MPETAKLTCYRASSPIHFDGKPEKPAWTLAPKSTPFVDIVIGGPAWFDTRVALLWDYDCSDFGFTAEKTDVWATLTAPDSKIYEGSDLEIFIAASQA